MTDLPALHGSNQSWFTSCVKLRLRIESGQHFLGSVAAVYVNRYAPGRRIGEMSEATSCWTVLARAAAWIVKCQGEEVNDRNLL